MNFPGFSLQHSDASVRSVSLHSPVETGKVKTSECKRSSALSRAALSFSRVSRGAGLRSFSKSTMHRKPQGHWNYLIESSIEGRGIRLIKGFLFWADSGERLAHFSNKRGYRCVHIRDASHNRHTFAVARIVCWLFHGPPPEPHYQADHINRVITDDRPENLRWVTRSENGKNISEEERHRRRQIRAWADLRGEITPGVKLSRDNVLEIRLSKESQRVLGERFGVAQTTISKIQRGTRWGPRSMNP